MLLQQCTDCSAAGYTDVMDADLTKFASAAIAGSWFVYPSVTVL
jgi:hypothetical protein